MYLKCLVLTETASYILYDAFAVHAIKAFRPIQDGIAHTELVDCCIKTVIRKSDSVKCMVIKINSKTSTEII